MPQRNLLKETIEFLDRANRSTSDVIYVTDGTQDISWEKFVELAKDVDYNGGFGRQEINNSLEVVGEDWWLERQEYDGAEWWTLKVPQTWSGIYDNGENFRLREY